MSHHYFLNSFIFCFSTIEENLYMIQHDLDLFYDIYNAIHRRYQKHIHYLLFTFLNLHIHFNRPQAQVIS